MPWVARSLEGSGASMIARKRNLWNLVWGAPQVDPNDLAHAIVEECQEPIGDYRTQLLIRDSCNALRFYWGENIFSQWLTCQSSQATILQILAELHGDEIGFPTLQTRIMEKTDPNLILTMLRELGLLVEEHIQLNIGGSIALILRGSLARATEEIDVVDEVPSALRLDVDLLNKLQRRNGLNFSHIPKSCLPNNWEKRLQFFGSFGKVRVCLVDPVDIFLSKLFSSRTKDRNDLRQLAKSMDREKLERVLNADAQQLLGEANLRQKAKDNWYILYGTELPIPDAQN